MTASHLLGIAVLHAERYNLRLTEAAEYIFNRHAPALTAAECAKYHQLIRDNA